MVVARRSSQLTVLAAADNGDERCDAPERPRTRADCKDGLRPCPWISCRHHLVDVAEAARATTVLDRELQTTASRESEAAWVDDVADALLLMKQSCTLDLAERGGGAADRDGLTLDELGAIFGVTRERIRQIEAQGLRVARIANRSRELRELMLRR